MLNPGQILDGKYEIINVLGKGGMGTVYLCLNKRLGNLWAVKEINSQWKNHVDFLAEPNILKQLRHVGIVRIVDIFYENDNLYIIEDYIEGETLNEYVKSKGKLTSELVKEITLLLCSILDYLHSFDPPIIYRDLKPSNIMITPNKKVVLIDFGIARTYKESQNGDTMILGSVGYIAPEQLTNIQSNTQTDIYSLGATMFYMITGKSISSEGEPMLQESYPEHTDMGLIKVIQKATSADPEKRYSNINLMISELNQIMSEKEYDKTMLMSSHEVSDGATKKIAVDKKRKRKGIKFLVIALFACGIALVIFLVFPKSDNVQNEKLDEVPAVSQTIGQAENNVKSNNNQDSNNEVKLEPKKEIEEKDIIIKGILDKDNPLRLSSGKGKGKDKNKDKTLQYLLNPAASLSNSKLAISINSIVRMDDEVIAILNIQNKANTDLKLDLSKTYLVNGKNQAVRVSYSNAMLIIPQGSNKQELKLYFRNFKLEGSYYEFKTVISPDKNINLTIAIKGDE